MMHFFRVVLGVVFGLELAWGKVSRAGIGLPGCEGNMGITGDADTYYCPPDLFAAQMKHFVRDDYLNTFRLPVGWQFLTRFVLGGPLDEEFMVDYDAIVQACLDTDSWCIIDVHNYARWFGGVIGEAGGPTVAQFTDLWSQLAYRYRNAPNVIFGIMNEPYTLNLTRWVQTVQETVNAIRAAGASSQWILLPGSNFASAAEFYKKNGAGDKLHYVSNPNGSTEGLFFEVHAYYDRYVSGTEAECTTNNIKEAFAPLAKWLRPRRRMALLAETGGGNTASCVKNVCAALDFLNANDDVFLGWVGWGAGVFPRDHVLSETPKGKQDTLLVKKCIAGRYINGK